jgi:hypothetical protein
MAFLPVAGFFRPFALAEQVEVQRVRTDDAMLLFILREPPFHLCVSYRLGIIFKTLEDYLSLLATLLLPRVESELYFDPHSLNAHKIRVKS